MSDYITIGEAAERLDVAPRTVTRMWRDGTLTGRMLTTRLSKRPYRLLIDPVSVEAERSRQGRSPLADARKGLPAGVGS